MPTDKTININVPVLARVEGEGALDLTISDQQITELKLRIFEPPRYFEKFLEGRNYYDVPDTVARICGICPVAYQMSAVHAIESIFNVTSTPWIRAMRRLFYCGEWLQSHSLHIHLLAAPDFLGFNSAITMSEQYGAEVRRGLRLQSLGNDLVALFGARSVHPVGVKVGGFSKAPTQAEVTALLPRVVAAQQDAIELIHWLDTFDLPDDRQAFISVALHHDDEYPFNEGRLISDNGLDIPISEFEQHFKEQHIDHSTALHCLFDGKPYLVGPLARLNLNRAQLPEAVQQMMQDLSIQFPSDNMFHSMMARALEIYSSLLEAESLLSQYQYTEQSCLKATPKAGTGFGCTEAPRGILWHRYDMDDAGRVIKAVIVPPTSQNQSRIEQDLKTSLTSFGLDKAKHELQLHAEKIIRNYDPCISCATHFLELSVTRDGLTDPLTGTLATEPLFSPININKTAIIGIGSPVSRDDLGFLAIDLLLLNPDIQRLQARGLTLLKLERPGISLTEWLEHYDHLILVDALKPAAASPDYQWLDLSQLNSSNLNFSSHQLGVSEALQLARANNHLPKDLALLALSKPPEQTLVSSILRCIMN